MLLSKKLGTSPAADRQHVMVVLCLTILLAAYSRQLHVLWLCCMQHSSHTQCVTRTHTQRKGCCNQNRKVHSECNTGSKEGRLGPEETRFRLCVACVLCESPALSVCPCCRASCRDLMRASRTSAYIAGATRAHLQGTGSSVPFEEAWLPFDAAALPTAA